MLKFPLPLLPRLRRARFRFCRRLRDRQLRTILLRYAPCEIHNRLANKATIYTHGNGVVMKDTEAALAGCKATSKVWENVTLETRKIAKLVKLLNGAQMELVLGDESSKVEGFLAHKLKGRVRGSFAEQLSSEMTEPGFIKTQTPIQ